MTSEWMSTKRRQQKKNEMEGGGRDGGGQGSTVWMDINIGSEEQHKKLLEEFERGQEFLRAVGESYGYGTSVNELDEDARTALQEIYASDPSWSSKGAMRLVEPPSLLAGRLTIQLFDEACPKTAENFRALCTGEKGASKANKTKHLWFKGNRFHRIITGFMCQGGDITRGDGSGGESIYNGKKFNDEKKGLQMKHQQVGTLSMANSGKNSNSSQFFFTFAENLTKLDGKHVVFGQVTSGVEVLKRIEDEAASKDGTPRVDVVIADCGQC
ncbi:Peptidyl-prolyl cis-trans isomerase [Balamuthia mandrillaris]